MAGWQSDRRERLPPNWASLRKQVFARDGHQCTWVNEGTRCTEEATDCDHVRPGDDHSLDNLRSLCNWHHQRKSSQEGSIAWFRHVKRTKKKFSRQEPHPGSLR